ncbi:MAG: SOS response-associated peptidase [Cytophagales bacterium]|nr:SOS response-associated peptidase [Cytophagales bacterium]
MSERYTIIAKAEEIEKRFRVEVPGTYAPRYNAAPTQVLPVITNEHPKELSFFYWGLIPGWAKGKSVSSKFFNARAETINEKASFKNALKRRRCLVPADGYYEWKRLAKKSKIPYRIFLSSGELFAFAGLWEAYEDEHRNTVHTFTIITTKANSSVSKIYERMPVILEPKAEKKWLEATLSVEESINLLQPIHESNIEYHPVSSLVNSISNDKPQLIVPTPPADQFGNLSLFD